MMNVIALKEMGLKKNMFSRYKVDQYRPTTKLQLIFTSSVVGN